MVEDFGSRFDDEAARWVEGEVDKGYTSYAEAWLAAAQIFPQHDIPPEDHYLYEPYPADRPAA